MLSLLALIIGAGEFYGYKLCKGKMTTKLPIIIMVIAIIIGLVSYKALKRRVKDIINE